MSLSELNLPELNRQKSVLIVLAASAVFVLSAFYGGMIPASENGDLNQATGFNSADVMFMNMMIIHHDQAIAMAELAPNRTENKNILELASNISESQRSENEKMAKWLEELGYQRPMRGHRMAGMATYEEMAQLRNSSGKEFDMLFSELMIEHHLGGIQMARAFIERGRNPELIRLERGMVEAQQKEVELMRSWRENWSTVE